LRKGTQIGHDCYIDSRVTSSGNCTVGNHVTLRYESILARGVSIGDYTYFSPKVMTNNVDTSHEQIDGAHIGSHVFVGTSCVLQHGITIGDHAIIGSLSFVNKAIPPHEIWFGHPARFYRKTN